MRLSIVTNATNDTAKIVSSQMSVLIAAKVFARVADQTFVKSVMNAIIYFVRTIWRHATFAMKEGV